MSEVQTPTAPSPVPPPPPAPPAPPLRNGKKVPRKSAKKKWIKRIIAIVVTVAIVAGIIFGMWFLVFRETEEKGEIYFENAYIGSIQSTVQGSGNANAKETATITIPANGIVQEVLVATGDVVSAGQPLFSIYSESAQTVLSKAQERMDALNEKLANLTLRAPFSGKLIDVTEFQTGDMVSEGPVGTLVNDKKLKISLYFSYAYDGQIQVGQAAEVSVPNMMYTTSAGRVDAINKVSYITPEGGMYFEVVVAFDNPGTLTAGMAASATLHSPAGEPIYPYDNGQTDYYETRTLTAKASGPLISSYLHNYANVTAGQVLLTMSAESLQEEISAAQEALTAAEKDVNDLNATASIDGTVISCTLAEGGEVKAGDAVITISDTTNMVVTISVDDRNIGFVKLGDTIELSDYNGGSYMGIVTNINTQGEVGQGMSSFPVTLEVENWDGTLYAGAWLDYSFVTSQSNDCVLVPTTAVKSVLDTEGEAHTVVFVYREEPPEGVVELDPNITNVPTAEDGYYPVEVETGISDTKAVEIKSGVDDGDQVFVNYVVTDYSADY